MGAQCLRDAELVRPWSRARSAALSACCCCFGCRSKGCRLHQRHETSLCLQPPHRPQTCPCLQPAQASVLQLRAWVERGWCPESCGTMLRLSPDMLPVSSCPV